MYQVTVQLIRGNLIEEREHIVNHIIRLENGNIAFIAGDRQEGRRWEYPKEHLLGFYQEPIDVA